MRRVLTLLMMFGFMLSFSASTNAQGLPQQAFDEPTNTPTPSPTATPTPTPAQNPQVPPRNPKAPTPTHVSVANCDVCGYCNHMSIDQVPDRWESCRTCVYRGFEEDLDPLENKTITAVIGEGGEIEGIPTPDLYYIYTDFGCISTKPGEFAAQISSFFFSIVGGIAFLFFIYGAGVIATSRSDPGKLNHGKRIIYGSIIGLLFALFSVFIIRFVASGIGLPNIGG